MKLSIYVILLLAASGCNSVNEKKNNAATSFTEKLIETATGNEVDMMDLNNTDKNKADIDMEIAGEDISNIMQGGFATLTATKDGLAFTITKDNNGKAHSIIIGITGPLAKNGKPFRAATNAEGDALKFSFATSVQSGNGIASKIATDAVCEISSLSDEKIVLKMTGKLGSMTSEAGSESDFSGTITLHYPAYNAIGMSKNEISY